MRKFPNFTPQKTINTEIPKGQDWKKYEYPFKNKEHNTMIIIIPNGGKEKQIQLDSPTRVSAGSSMNAEDRYTDQA